MTMEIFNRTGIEQHTDGTKEAEPLTLYDHGMHYSVPICLVSNMIFIA